MADVWEKDLGQKSSFTVNDFVRVVGSDNVSYKQPVSEVLYAGGVRYKEFVTGTAFSDFADSCNIGITFSYIRYPTQSSDSPTSTNGRCAITVCKTYSDEITMSVTFFANATENIIYERRRYGTWGSWVQLPTRAEIDALKSKTYTTLTKSTSIDVFEYYTYKYGSLFTGYIIFRPSNDIADAGEIVSAGIPTLIVSMQLPVTCVAGTQAGQTGRCRIGSGKIVSWYSAMPLKAGNTYLISVNAICS